MMGRSWLRVSGAGAGRPLAGAPASSWAWRTWRLPPPRSCSLVTVPVQLLEKRRPPALLVTCREMVSALPGSPLSVICTCMFMLPPSAMGLPGLVMSVTFALLVKVAFCTPVDGTVMFSESMALLLNWMTRPSLMREIRLTLPCRFVPLLLNLTLRPKFVLAPAAPAYVPAEAELTRYPPPPMEPAVGFFTVTTEL